MPRAQRFPDSFHQALQSLVLSVMPHITIRPMEIPEEARCINLSLANLIKVGTSAWNQLQLISPKAVWLGQMSSIYFMC